MRTALIFTLLTAPLLFAEVPPHPWVSIGADGKLIYQPDSQGNIIPDFSNCGYHGGGVALPSDVPAKMTLNPQPEGDDGARIQSALDEVGRMPVDSHGFRGAVQLAKGTYRIAGSLRLLRGGVILRGDGEDGTILIATGKNRRALIQAGGASGGDEDKEAGAPSRSKKARAESGLSRKITDRYVPVGSHVITLDDVAGLHVKDNVIVHRPSTENWIHTLGMDQIPPRSNGGKVNQWAAGSKDLNFDRIITAIEGNRVTLDAPLVNSIDAAFGGGDLHLNTAPARIREVAVENLRGVSEYSGDTDEEHSWTFISFAGVENGFIRNITSLHFANNLIALGGDAKWITVRDCACLDPISQITGGRRYSFSMNRCQLCLVQRCSARNGRHDFVMGSSVAGPNVFTECRAEKAHADAGPHHRWSVGTLYDRLMLPDGQLNLRDRGNMGSGHGWAGANQVCWNCLAKSMIVQNPPTAQNWAIGCTAAIKQGNGIWESPNRAVEPKSLYLAQLKDRLGAKAASVE